MILYYTLLLTLALATAPFFSDRLFGFTIEKHLGLLCLLYALAYLPKRKSPVRPWRSSQAHAFLFFFALAGVSWLTLSRQPFQESTLFVYLSELVFLVSTLTLVDSQKRLRWTLVAVLAGVVWGALYTLREWQKAVPIYGISYRPLWSPAGDPNYFTASAVLCLPIAVYLLIRSPSRFDRFISGACLVPIMAAILVDASRGGLVALSAAGAVILFQIRGRRTMALLLGGALSVVLLLSPASPIHRLLHPNYSDVAAQNNRLELWSAGLRMTEAHPLAGIGLDNFKTDLPTYLDAGQRIDFIAHNTYLQMLAEMGLPGLIGFLWIIAVTLKSLARSSRRAMEANSMLMYCAASGLFSGVVGFSVAMFFLSAQFLKVFWFAVFLSAAVERLTLTSRTEKLFTSKVASDQETAPRDHHRPRRSGKRTFPAIP